MGPSLGRLQQLTLYAIVELPLRTLGDCYVLQEPHPDSCIALCCGCVWPRNTETGARGYHQPQGQKIGTAKILAAKEGVNIEVNASQLPPGIHGVHIHNVGKCDPAGNSGPRIACGVIQK